MGSSGESFGNLYLVAGIRGGYEPLSRLGVERAAFDVLHTLIERWGLPAPWGPCDSEVDLTSADDGALRAWAHVDLRVADVHRPDDAPVVGLLRTMWDSLELVGSVALTGVDALVPLECVGEALWHRVAMSPVRVEDRGSGEPARVLVQAVTPYTNPGEALPPWDIETIAEHLSEWVDVQELMGSLPMAAYPPAPIPSPFHIGIEGLHSPWPTSPFRAEVTLTTWTIDDAAWLVEAVCHSCVRGGVAGNVEIAVRLLR